MVPQAGDARGAERAPSSIRIAHISNIRSRTVAGTLSAHKVLEATRTSTNLRDLTEQVQDVLARHGRKEVDPSDPKKRSYYDTAREEMRVLLPGVDCPPKTRRAGMSYLYHNERYPFDVDIDVDPAQLSVIRDALAAWPHTCIVARSVSHEALWTVAHGPKADSQGEFEHYHRELIAQLPDVVRPHVAEGQHELARPRFWPWDPEAIMGADVQADLPPMQPPPNEGGGADGRQNGHDDASAERARARSALQNIPLGPDTYGKIWLPVGMALVNADLQFGPHFDGCGLFVEWSTRASPPGSTKPGRALETYQKWTEENARRPEDSRRRTLGSLYALAREHGWTPPSRESAARGSRVDGGPSSRPTVIVGRDLHSETQAVIDNIADWNQPPTLFSNADATSPVELAAGEVRPVSREQVAAVMSAATQFLSQGARGKASPCYPPHQLIGAVYAAIPRHLPPLYGIKRAPFFLGGRMVSLQEPGYHADSGYWIDQGEGWDLGLDVEEAVMRIEDLVGQFPYAGGADRACAYGLLIGQVLKVEWPSPILEVSKPASHTGATKMCQSFACLADGVYLATITAAAREEETDKRLITQLKTGRPSILIDNVSRKFASDIVASGMTSKHIGGRLLGRNETASVLTTALQIYITGVNEMLSRDMINRSISVRIDAKVEHPEERGGFRHELPSDAMDNRQYYFSAALSLVQRWIDAGRPGPPAGFKPLDSFRPWMNSVAGILHMAGIAGFHENRTPFLERADDSGAAEWTFVSLWLQTENTMGCLAKDLVELGERVFELRGNDEPARAVSLGARLSQMRDKVFVLDGKSYKLLRYHSRRGSEYSLVSHQTDESDEESVTS